MTDQAPPPSDPNQPNPVNYATPNPASTAGAYQGPPPDKDSVTMGMLCHLLGIFTWFIGPLIIWLMKKETSPFVDDQGKESLNFEIAFGIVAIVCIPILLIPCLGILLWLAIHVVRLVFCIMATVEANKGIAYRYPVTFRLIK